MDNNNENINSENGNPNGEAKKRKNKLDGLRVDNYDIINDLDEPLYTTDPIIIIPNINSETNVNDEKKDFVEEKVSPKPKKKNEESTRVKGEYDKIKDDVTPINYSFEDHLASDDDLPNLGEIEIYDYDSDITVVNNQSMEVLESLVDLYLSDVPNLKDNSYIKNKMKEDAMVYAEAIFLTRMTRKNFLNQMRQIDNGDNSPRQHEVLNQTIKEIRENAKFLSGQRTELEKFYKNLRIDLGYDQIEKPVEKEEVKVKDVKVDEPTGSTEIVKVEEKDDGVIMDNKKLNELIQSAMLARMENNDRNKRKPN